MITLSIAAAGLLGYLLGSIPVGYLVGKAWGVDVRAVGSGRMGGTNVLRATDSKLAAAITIVGDALKGVAAVWLVRWLLPGNELAAVLAGAGAVYGHIWPVFLRFQGGAGGVTAALAQIALNPWVGVPSLLLGIYVMGFSRYASLGTLTVGVSGLVLSVLLWWVRPDLVSAVYILFAALATVAIVITLQPNLRRLRRGEERRITLW
ncbi:MAG: glycerol-3-phosphate acyltransferase [Caldilineales bacterium]|nr:glycerol-3-phosphate acyltransferase [Caldilineales bacterium]MDW8316965.1 glycerol-3-phosphate acyltransferase [Anaerolineae bacterium]